VVQPLMPSSSYRLGTQNMVYMCRDPHYWGDAALPLRSLQRCALPEVVWIGSFTAVVNCLLLIALCPWQEA